MAILVTGGAGYIGSVTVERLTSKGESVVVLDDLAHGHRESFDAAIPFYQGSAGDRGLVARIVKEHAIESCIHFASLISVGESEKNPAEYFENNVGQGISLLGALLHAGVRRFVFSSTAAVYGEPEKMPIGEDCPQWPKNPYGWTKFTLERLLETYDAAYGLKSICLRYFNASGATDRCGEDHDPETHLIPNVLAAAADPHKEVRIFGNQYPTPDGTPIRDYIHVADLADAHIGALDHLRRRRKFSRVQSRHGPRLFRSRSYRNRSPRHRLPDPRSNRSSARGRSAPSGRRSLARQVRARMVSRDVRFILDHPISVGLAKKIPLRLQITR